MNYMVETFHSGRMKDDYHNPLYENFCSETPEGAGKKAFECFRATHGRTEEGKKAIQPGWSDVYAAELDPITGFYVRTGRALLQYTEK